MKGAAMVLAVWFAVGLAFWRFLVWATGLDREAAERRRIDAEFARIVEELHK